MYKMVLETLCTYMVLASILNIGQVVRSTFFYAQSLINQIPSYSPRVNISQRTVQILFLMWPSYTATFKSTRFNYKWRHVYRIPQNQTTSTAVELILRIVNINSISSSGFLTIPMTPLQCSYITG